MGFSNFGKYIFKKKEERRRSDECLKLNEIRRRNCEDSSLQGCSNINMQDW